MLTLNNNIVSIHIRTYLFAFLQFFTGEKEDINLYKEKGLPDLVPS
jgi:hypothetical protein